tara:strand:- start:608 stop:2152 length:1545 start_codon:yes stop_codon:yes gene_type:complete
MKDDALTKDFIAKAKKVHGNKFDYSKVNYKLSRIKVTIICPTHGEFLQTPSNHLSGRGCETCSYIGRSLKDNEHFLNKAREKHGNKYDYSKVQYKGNKKKVVIICDKHGEFLKSPDNHYKGQGCPECGDLVSRKKRRIGLDEFIKRSNKIHNNKYNYSRVEYVTNNIKVKILCDIHGEFLQTPSSHLQGRGCKQCGLKRTKEKLTGRNVLGLSNESFIEKANKVHNNKYDYSILNYVNSRIKVDIICPEHGEFKQNPSNHLDGDGCKKCYFDSTRISSNEFIKRAINKYGSKYDYSKMQYVDFQEKVIIICPEHGEFQQTPTGHLIGGCVECGYEELSKIKSDTREEFIDKAISVHGKIYDYSKVVYKNSHTKVIIICKEHGEFEQKPNNHIEGQECPSCAEYGYDKNEPATLYIHEIKLSNGKHALKYGITNNDYKARAKKQRRGIDGTLKNIFNFRTSGITVLDTETLIARHFDNEGYLTKEEMLDGFSETAEYTKENLDAIMSIINKQFNI